MVNFAEPHFLYGFFLIPLFFLFWFWTYRRRARDLARMGDAELIHSLSAAVNRRARFWRGVLWFVVFALLIVSLARPRWGTTVQKVESQGIQVIIALDVSPSMLAEDIKPSRLSRAKLEAVDLLGQLGGDEVGLVLFSGSAYLQFPLTNDYSTARSFIEAAAPELISRPGTAVGEAVRIAARSFNPKRASQKVILILSDGEDHAADTMESVRQAAEQDIRIDAIGFGTSQGAPVPQFNEAGEVVGFLKDERGEVVISHMDEGALQRISALGEGGYWRAGASGAEIPLLLAEWGRLQKDRGETRFEHLPIERFQYFLLPALILLAVMELIPQRKRKSPHETSSAKNIATTLTALLLVFILSGCSASARRLNNEGNRLYQKGDYEKALENYRSAQKDLPDASEPIYNEANAHYRGGAFDQAAQTLQKALEKAKGDLAQKAFYNMGNAFYQAGLWDKAADAYRNALRILPGDEEAKYNLELALQKQEEQKQQQQQKAQQEKTEDRQQQEERQGETPAAATPTQPSSSQPESTQQPQASAQPGPVQGMSPEQARQLLESAAQDTQSLQQYLQKLQPTAVYPPGEAW